MKAETQIWLFPPEDNPPQKYGCSLNKYTSKKQNGGGVALQPGVTEEQGDVSAVESISPPRRGG